MKLGITLPLTWAKCVILTIRSSRLIWKNHEHALHRYRRHGNQGDCPGREGKAVERARSRVDARTGHARRMSAGDLRLGETAARVRSRVRGIPRSRAQGRDPYRREPAPAMGRA